MPCHFFEKGGFMKKSLLNRLYAILLSFGILACSVLSVPALSVCASDPVSWVNLARYILTVSGVVDIASDAVNGITGGKLDDLVDALKAAWNGGNLYIDSNGDYVFNNESSADIYEVLTSMSSADARVVSSFPDVAANSEGYNPLYFSPQFIQNYDNFKLNHPYYLVFFTQHTTSSNSIVSYCGIVDISNVAFFTLRDGSYMYFYSASGSSINVVGSFFDCTYYPSTDSFSNSGPASRSNNSLALSPSGSSFNQEFFYFNFPSFSYDYNGYNVCAKYKASRSIVVSKSSVYGQSLYEKNSGVVYYNTYNTIPSVSSDVITNNNWENIYNSYVTNVNNEYQQIYETNGSVTAEELREILKSIGDRIDEIINDAGGEIIENLDDILIWLSRIYDRLDEIKNASGDNADVIEAIESVNDNLDLIKGDTLYLARLYALLGDILDKMNNSGGSGRGYPDIVLDLPDIDNTNIMDYISTGQVIASTLETVLPFAYVPMLEQLLLSLSAEPVTPHWEIPFKIENSFVSIDETIVIDLDQFNSLRLVLNSLIMIGFLIFLIWFTFYLTDIVGNMLF